MSAEKKAGVTKLLSDISSLLEHESASRRHAAAIVLGELAPDKASVLEALRQATKHPKDAVLRRYAVEAIGEIAPKSVVKDLRPLIKDSDPAVREAVKKVLASGKGVSAEDVAEMLESRDEKQRIGAIAVLGAMGHQVAQQRLLQQLAEASPRILTAIEEALIPIYEAADDAAAYDALMDFEAVAAQLDFKEPPELAESVVRMLLAIGLDGGTDILMRVVTEANSDAPRIAAVEAMRRVVQGKKLSQRVFRFLLDLLESEDLPEALVVPITGTLAGLDVPLNLEARLRTLLTAPTTAVRRWAITALGGLDMVPAARAVAQLTIDGDPTDRALALKALLQTEAGRAALGRSLALMKEADRAAPVAAALREHVESLPRSTRTALEEAVIESPVEVSTLIVDLLEADGGLKAYSGVMERAMRLKAAREYAEAVDLLRRITRGASASPEMRFELGVCELMASKRKITRGHNSDPCLATFLALNKESGFSLIDHLHKEPDVGDAELYYLGFSLTALDEGEVLGGDVLSLLLDHAEDPKLKQAAENKLKTMGWRD